MNRYRFPWLLLASLVLSACASLPRDRGMAAVNVQVAAQTGVDAALREGDAATESPSSDATWGEADLVRHALNHHPDFARLRAELGLAAVERFEAGRLENPGIGYSDLDVDEAGALNVLSWRVHLPLAQWLLAPAQARIGQAHWQAALQRVAAEVGVRVRAVRAARIRLAQHERAARIATAEADVADAARALARRMFEAGTVSRKQLASERAAAADAALAAVEARSRRDRARLALARAIGWADVANLPAIDLNLSLPAAEDAPRDALLERALREHPDLVAAQHEALAAQRAAKIARRAWWLLDLDAEYERERGDDGVIERGPGFSLSLPLFRQGQDVRLQARAREERAQAERAEVELRIRQQVDAALSARRAARERIALLREDVLPSHEALVREHQREYDFMLIGAFELIDARRDQYRAYREYVEAVADYQLAGIALARAVGADVDTAAAAEPMAEPELPNLGDTP